MTNQSLHNATPKDKDFGAKSITWDEADYSWNDATGTWDNPYRLTNQAVHTATMSDKNLDSSGSLSNKSLHTASITNISL